MNEPSIQQHIDRLRYICQTVPARIAGIPEEILEHKTKPEKWSKKEILGHLIDSASNNHQRFIRIQFEDNPVIYYDQDKWNQASRYNDMNTEHLLTFWALYNRHLLEIIERIPEAHLQRTGTARNSHSATLAWYIADYVAHMEHHLSQIIENY